MDPIIAGSWAGFIGAVARSRPPASVGEVVVLLLTELDDPRAAEVLVKHEVKSRSDILRGSELIKAVGPHALEPLLMGLESGYARDRARAAGFLMVVPDS